MTTTEFMTKVTNVVIDTSNSYLISTCKNMAFVWNLKEKRLNTIFEKHIDTISDIAISSDGRFCVTSSWNGQVIIWDFHTGREISSISKTYPILQLEISKDNRYIYFSSWTGGITSIYDVYDRRIIEEYSYKNGIGEVKKISNDGSFLLTEDSENISIFSLSSINLKRKHVFIKRDEFENVATADFSSDNKFVYICMNDDCVSVYSLETGEEVFVYYLVLSESAIIACRYTYDGLLIALKDGKILRLSSNGHDFFCENDCEFKISKPVSSADISIDGSICVFGLSDGTVIVCDIIHETIIDIFYNIKDVNISNCDF